MGCFRLFPYTFAEIIFELSSLLLILKQNKKFLQIDIILYIDLLLYCAVALSVLCNFSDKENHPESYGARCVQVSQTDRSGSR